MTAQTADEKKYVTYYWLLGSLGGTLAIICAMFIGLLGWLNAQLDKKVDKDLFNVYCNSLSKIENTINENNRVIHILDRNQVRVMQKLKIQPERPE